MVWGIKDKVNGQYTCQGTGEYWEPGGIYNNIMSWDVTCEYDSGLKLHFLSTDQVAQQKHLALPEIKRQQYNHIFWNKRLDFSRPGKRRIKHS
jgi:hypothetical protein